MLFKTIILKKRKRKKTHNTIMHKMLISLENYTQQQHKKKVFHLKTNV